MERQEELRLTVASKIVKIFGQKQITLKKIAEYEEALKQKKES
jgi:ArsR family metal-binding transcriptional regulator